MRFVAYSNRIACESCLNFFWRCLDMNQRLGVFFCLALVALSAKQVVAQKHVASGQASATAAAQPQSSAPPKERSMREIVMMPVVYRVPGMDQVKVKSNLKY